VQHQVAERVGWCPKSGCAPTSQKDALPCRHLVDEGPRQPPKHPAPGRGGGVAQQGRAQGGRLLLGEGLQAVLPGHEPLQEGLQRDAGLDWVWGAGA
jgi:hypothetical protein